MRISYKLLSFLLLFVSNSGFSQSDSASYFQFITEISDSKWETNSAKVVIGSEGNSNTINAGMLSDYFLKSSFSQDYKQAFLDSDRKRTNLFIDNYVRGSYVIDNLRKAYLDIGNQVFIKGNKELSELVAFGNKSFENQTVKSSNTSVLGYNYVSIGMVEKLKANNSWSIESNYGVKLVSGLTDISAGKVSLYTGLQGEYLDIEAE